MLLLFEQGKNGGNGCSTHETMLAAAHLKNMGRDEMNLGRVSAGDAGGPGSAGMQDAGFRGSHLGPRPSGSIVVRRLTISASDKYGLPTAMDDEVILGLVQLTKAAGFADRRVRFSRYQLIRLLGWRDEGRSYRRLEQSLKRWLGVTLYYENAWWDKAQKRWVDAHFHLLDDWCSIVGQTPHAGVSASSGDATSVILHLE